MLFDEAALDIEEQLIQTSVSGLTYIAEMKWVLFNDGSGTLIHSSI